jgi:nitroreductase
MPVEQEKVEKLLRAAMAAPSGGNQQPWEFIVVTDEKLRADLSGMARPAQPAKAAPLDIIILGNKDRMRFPELWQQDLGAAAENILLEAVELGLGGVWLGTAPIEGRMNYIRDMFSLPENLDPYAVLCIGYPDAPVVQQDRFDPDRIHYNKY